MCQAALQIVRRGWPVFPCRERDEAWRNAAGKTGLFKAKAPYTGKGLKDATTDEARILTWWRQHPEAMIGLPMGGTGCFAIDFDPRVEDVVDPETGEITGQREWTLEELKAALEAQIGVPLPPSLTARTPSGGVHVWFRQPEGAPIRNRGNLPDHVDVRGDGGYVVAPPSLLVDGSLSGATAGEYRWISRRGDWRDDAAIAEAPAELVDVLRAPKGRPSPERAAGPAARTGPSTAARAEAAGDAVRRYALSALDAECRAIRGAASGRRNHQLNESAFKIATLVAAGALDAGVARSSVEAAARDNPGRDDAGALEATISSGWTAGLNSPRDLGEVTAASDRRRREVRAARPAPAPARAVANEPAPFRSGRVDGQLVSEAEGARFGKATAAWLKRRLAQLEPTPDAVTRLAFAVGQRIAAGLLVEAEAREALWGAYELIPGVRHEDVDRAIDDGHGRAFDFGRLQLLDGCARYPMTDFGIAERFRDRCGQDFRFTTAKGWLGWDGRRWKVLDQDEKTPPAEVIAAVFDVIRAIQDEGRYVADSGVRVTEDDLPEGELYRDRLNPHGLDAMIPKGKSYELLSSRIKAWGRQSETTGKPAAVALLARRWLTVPIEDFDRDKYAFNVMNGTLRFRVEEIDDQRRATVELLPHAREDMQTKLSPVTYDPRATSLLYDGMLEWAQPDRAMRRYLHQVGGYALTGDAGEQKLWFWYGRGRNGKGTTLDVWQHVSGEYSDNIPIGSFLDQGIKKRGDQASPDLAKLGGVRLLRSSEPGRNEKLDSGLIKLVTGGDPLPVRMLHRGFFNLQPLFKLIIMGNTRFDIPDTDDGIWSRMKLIPWARNIERPEPGVENWPKKDPELPAKIIRQEASGVLNRLIGGLLDYLENGLAEPSEVTAATDAYRDTSDPLARFMRHCTIVEEGSKIQSSKLHEVFVAWAKAAGEREWSNKGLSRALEEKGYRKKASDGMWWLDLRLVKEAGDFVDDHGKARALEDDAPFARARDPDDDDDMPL